jgi:hypothetical protein
MGFFEGAIRGVGFDVTVNKEIQHLFGTTETLLTRPAGDTVLYVHVEQGDFRLKPGNYVQQTITAADAGTEKFTITGHPYATGDGPYLLAGTTLPSGVNTSTPYWIIKTGVNDFQLALSYADATASPAVPVLITTNGTPGDWKIGGMPAALAVGASVTNGMGTALLTVGTFRMLAAPSKLTVKGYGTAALTYWWV